MALATRRFRRDLVSAVDAVQTYKCVSLSLLLGSVALVDNESESAVPLPPAGQQGTTRIF